MHAVIPVCVYVCVCACPCLKALTVCDSNLWYEAAAASQTHRFSSDVSGNDYDCDEDDDDEDEGVITAEKKLVIYIKPDTWTTDHIIYDTPGVNLCIYFSCFFLQEQDDTHLFLSIFLYCFLCIFYISCVFVFALWATRN